MALIHREGIGKIDGGVVTDKDEFGAARLTFSEEEIMIDQ